MMPMEDLKSWVGSSSLHAGCFQLGSTAKHSLTHSSSCESIIESFASCSFLLTNSRNNTTSSVNYQKKEGKPIHDRDSLGVMSSLPTTDSWRAKDFPGLEIHHTCITHIQRRKTPTTSQDVKRRNEKSIHNINVVITLGGNI